MSTKRLLILTLLALSASTMSFASLINPISASVDLSMSSDAGCGTVTSAPSYQDWITNPPVLGDLSSTADVLANCTHPNRNVETSGTLTATWSANTKKGTIKFNNIGWKVNNNVSFGAANANLGTDYTYTSMPTNATLFDLNYDIKSRGDLNGFGLNGFYVTLTNFNALQINTTGDLTWILSPGQTYTLTIENGANISGNIAGLKEYMDGTFKFTATAVPEPSSLLMLSGVLAFAGSLRKKLIG